MRGTTQLKNNKYSPLKYVTVHPFVATSIFTTTAPGGNSFYYLYRFSPTIDSLLTGIVKLLNPFVAFHYAIGYISIFII